MPMNEATKKCKRCKAQLDSDGSCPYCITSVWESKLPDSKHSHDKAQNTCALLVDKSTNKRYTLDQAVNKIGRDPANDISLTEDSYISRFHAWILNIKGSFWVEDLGSTNGSALNGEALKERKQIFPSDCLKFGRTELFFELE